MPTIADAILQEGIEKGIEKGIEEGIEREKLEAARKMARMGMSAADIRKITGLPLEQIESIRKRA